MTVLYPDLLYHWTAPGNLPQALLIAGPAGIGKRALALEIARGIIDTRQEIDPDLFLVTPNEELKTRPIDVDGIRQLSEKLALTVSGAGRRAVVILEADRMNANAANALLKMLEEPPAGCHMILTADHPWKLPVTIRSRLQIKTLAKPDADFALALMQEEAPDLDEATAQRLLSLAGGAPYAALQHRDKAIDIADEIAAIADKAMAGAFPRDRALALTQKCGDADFTLGADLVLRYLHGTGLAAGSLADKSGLSGLEQKGMEDLAKRAGPAKAAEAFRAAAELRRQAESQNLPKAWILYRMTLSLEWLSASKPAAAR